MRVRRDTSLLLWQLTATLVRRPVFKMLHFSGLHGDGSIFKSLQSGNLFCVVVFGKRKCHSRVDGQSKHNQRFVIKGIDHPNKQVVF